MTDRGASFMSALIKQLCRILGIRQVFTTMNHPQTDRLVEQMNQTIKDMLRKMAGASHPSGTSIWIRCCSR